MSQEAARVDHADLGVDDRGIGAEAVLYADGDVTIGNDQNEGLVLDAEQIRALCAFLLDQPVLDAVLRRRDT